MMEYAWLIPLLPFLSFIILIFFGRKLKENSAVVGSLLLVGSLILSILVLIDRFNAPTYEVKSTWLTIGEVEITMGFVVNQLNALMLFIVSFVSFLVHVYSKGYMKGDERFPVFYRYLGLFSFSMLALVLSPNLLQLYIFWELVGVSSFLLIGYYFYKEEAKKAAKKAFIVTRIGDVGLFAGMILLFLSVGSFDYDAIFAAVSDGTLSPSFITLTALFIFIGAVGKSGQFPLHTWLPDAMEGPTPVSALIHAATMVAAGVYLVATMYPLFLASETALTVVAVTGGFTAIFAASIGLVQKDIKRILAYSTVSQLGYMMLALGATGYVAGVFHLTTHAFFKALLFLAAGSIIHAVHTQNIDEMGGLWKKLKITGPLFLIGALAITGFPLFSGFFSKDEILMVTYADGRYGLFTLAVIAAFFTAFYMFRLFFLVFFGEKRYSEEDVSESPSSMTIPMMVLAVFALFSGYINTPWTGTFLADWLQEGQSFVVASPHGPAWIPVLTVTLSLIGILLAYVLYGRGTLPQQKAPFFYEVLYHKYYIDELYDRAVVRPVRAFSQFLHAFDELVVDGLVQTTVGIVQGTGKVGSKIQNGQVQTYAAVGFVGLAVIIFVIAVTGGYLK